MDFDFQWWMLLPLLPLSGFGFLTYKVVRTRRRARHFLMLTRAERVRFARIVLTEPDIPLVSRVLVAAAAAYLALPLDLIPDFIPILGHADDFLFITALLALVHRTLTASEVETLIRRACGTEVLQAPPVAAA